MSKAKDGIKVACEEGSCLALRATLKNPAAWPGQFRARVAIHHRPPSCSEAA